MPPVPTPERVIHDNLRDKLRRVNNSVIYLGNAVNGLTNYYLLLKQETKEEQKNIYQNLYRQMCRNVCIELHVYFEKVKTLIRYYFDFKGNVQNGLKTISHNYVEIKNLLDVYTEIVNNPVFNKVMRIRNDEIHNESSIDDLEYDFSESTTNGLEVIVKGFFISNDELYYDIKLVLGLGNNFRDAMQNIISRINRIDYYNKREKEK